MKTLEEKITEQMIEFGFVKSNENLTVRREEPLICFEINPELRQNQIGGNTINKLSNFCQQYKLSYGILLIETYPH